MAYPSFRATQKTLNIVSKKYGETHRKNGPANAFRHALWSALLAHEALNWGKDIYKSLAWAKNITDRHEKIMPNKELAKAMDLHNNGIGRNVYLENYLSSDSFTLDAFIKTLAALAANSVLVTQVPELEKLPTKLVYIEII